MPIKPIKEIYTDLGGNITVEYSDDSTMKFNQADTVTASVNAATGVMNFLSPNGASILRPTGLSTAYGTYANFDIWRDASGRVMHNFDRKTWAPTQMCSRGLLKILTMLM